MQLSVAQRLKILRQEVLSKLNPDQYACIRISNAPAGVSLDIDDKQFFAPSPLRWKLYKHGWERRLDQLENEYGVGRYITLDSSCTVFDIGANAGEFAFVSARYSARTFCFEPDPIVYDCLQQNTASLDDVYLSDHVVWHEDGEIEFGSAPERADSSVFMSSDKSITKETIRLDTFCQQNNITSIDLLKCDAEGAEPEVLQGAGDLLYRVKAVALDTGAERLGERTHLACESLLRDHGFTVIEEKIGTRWMTFGMRDAA